MYLVVGKPLTAYMLAGWLAGTAAAAAANSQINLTTTQVRLEYRLI